MLTGDIAAAMMLAFVSGMVKQLEEAMVGVVEFLHVLVAVGMIGGWIGRQFTRTQARRTNDIRTLEALMVLSGRFENLLIIPCSLLVFVIGVVLSFMAGWPVLGFLQGSSTNWLLVSVILYLSVFPLVVFVFLPRGKVFEARLQEAVRAGHVTPELQTAFEDPAVRAAHGIEAALLVAVLFLMVAKPF